MIDLPRRLEVLLLPLLAALSAGACSDTQQGENDGGGAQAGTANVGGAGGRAAAGAPATAGTGGAPGGSGGALGGSGGAASGGGNSGNVGGAGSSPAGGLAGVGGGGAPNVGGSSAGGTGGGAGTGTSGCAGKSYLICEDFEATAVGAVPTGWSAQGNATVTDAQAANGKRSLAIAQAANGARRITHPGATLGSEHWGRIRYKVQLPVPDAFVHSTLVALQGDGPTRGPEEVRVVDTVKNSSGNGSKHQFLYNVQASDGEFGKGSPYDYSFDGQWHCAEWHVKAADQSYEFFFDDERLDSISFVNGAGNYPGAEIPNSFEQVRVGWNNYQSASPGFSAWIDDVAMDEQRIGCD